MSLLETFFNVEVLLSSLPALFRGLMTTLALGIASIVVGTVVGLGVTLLRLYAPRPLQLLAIVYVDVFRALPMLVVLIVIYYALPFVGIRLSAWASAITALSIVLSAYSSEVFRAGIEAVPKGQFEAAAALGMHFPLILAKVVLPQAMKIVIPPQTSNFVSIIKETSLASVVAMPELLKEATDAQALNANPTPLIGAAIIYLVLLWPLVRLVGWLEARAANQRGR
ncbi:amino acid ABC transporter permease [Alsobacter sp. R-9]